MAMSTAPWLGVAVLASGILLYDGLLHALRRVDRAFPPADPTKRTWWLGYARDVANLVGAAALAAGFLLLGLPGPNALLAGCLLGLVAYGLDYLLARRLGLAHPTLMLAAIVLAVAVACAVLRAEVSGALARIIDLLFSPHFARRS